MDEKFTVSSGYPIELSDEELQENIDKLVGYLAQAQYNQISWCSAKLQVGLYERQRREHRVAIGEQGRQNNKMMSVTMTINFVAIFITIFVFVYSSVSSNKWEERQIDLLSQVKEQNTKLISAISSEPEALPVLIESDVKESMGSIRDELSLINENLSKALNSMTK